MAVQQRPLNEEITKKQISGGLKNMFQITKCDLCIQEIPHSFFE